MNENYNTPNSGCCGRPMAYTKEPQCGQNRCYCDAHPYKMNACIRRQRPDCTAQAIIPAITLENVDGLTNYCNTLVHVTSNNTTYYVDDKGTPIITWRGDVETQLPDSVTDNDDWEDFLKSFDLKSQLLYVRFYNSNEDKYYMKVFYYDNAGRIYWAGEFEEIIMGGDHDIH